MKRKNLIFMLALAMATDIAAQSIRELTPDALFAIADSTEESLHAKRIGVEVADKELQAAEASRLPDINVSLSASYLGNGYVWERDFSDGMAVEIPHFGANFALSVNQVIYAGGAVNNGIALTRQGKRMSELDYEKSRQQVHFRLLGDFLNLYKAQNQVGVYDENIRLTEKVVEQLAAKQAQGIVLQNALTRYELLLENMRLQRQRIANSCDIYNRQLLTALDMDSDSAASIVIAPCIPEMTPQQEALGDVIDRAMTNSPDLQQMETLVEMGRLKERVAQADKLPRVVLFAQEHLDGPVTIEVPVLNKNFNYWAVGVGISYNLSALYKNGDKVRAARLGTLQSISQTTHVEEQLTNAVEEAYIRLQEACNEVAIRTKSVELARENYRITANRYDNDLALLTDMLDASNAVLAAELELKNAHANQAFCYYKLRFVCGEL